MNRLQMESRSDPLFTGADTSENLTKALKELKNKKKKTREDMKTKINPRHLGAAFLDRKWINHWYLHKEEEVIKTIKEEEEEEEEEVKARKRSLENMTIHLTLEKANGQNSKKFYSLNSGQHLDTTGGAAIVSAAHSAGGVGTAATDQLAAVEKKLVGLFLVEICVNPTFIINHPEITSSLGKWHKTKPNLIESFELFSKKFEAVEKEIKQKDVASSDPFKDETTTSRTLTSSCNTRIDSLPLPTLPSEIIVETLSRVPVKFLMQFQCVSKPWKSLISNPKFVRKHFHMSKKPHQLILTLSNPLLDEFFYTAYPLSSVFTEVTPTAIATQYPLNKQNLDLIVGSCQGILCFDLGRGFTLLWNPSIRKFSELPSSLEDPHQLGAHVTYGFGYDYFSGAFKVVAIFAYDSDSSGNLDDEVFKAKVKVHTVGTKTWRRIQDFPYGVPFDESGKFVCGTVNWLTCYDSDYVIVSLDLEKESYRKLLMPCYGEVVVVKSTLEVLMDCLCTLAFAYTFSDVWLLKEFGNDEFWIKLFRLPSIEDPYGFSFYNKLLYVFEDGKVLLQFQSELVVYNPLDGTLKTLEIQHIYGVSEVYHESAVSPLCFDMCSDEENKHNDL